MKDNSVSLLDLKFFHFFQSKDHTLILFITFYMLELKIISIGANFKHCTFNTTFQKYSINMQQNMSKNNQTNQIISSVFQLYMYVFLYTINRYINNIIYTLLYIHYIYIILLYIHYLGLNI